MGTYNYVGPSSDGHYTYDVAPYYKWGNDEEQDINQSEYTGFALENGRYLNNLDYFYGNNAESNLARVLYDEYYNILNS